MTTFDKIIAQIGKQAVRIDVLERTVESYKLYAVRIQGRLDAAESVITARECEIAELRQELAVKHGVEVQP